MGSINPSRVRLCRPAVGQATPGSLQSGAHARISYYRVAVLIPKFFTTIQDYDREQFTRDVIAGVIVGVVALPLAIAFAIASGLPPERGLSTAIIAGFLISVLGGSRGDHVHSLSCHDRVHESKS